MYELFIERSDGTWQRPAVIEPVIWETYRKETPGKLTFTVIKDNVLSFNEGARVQFKVNGIGVFLGYVFQKQRDKDQHIKVVAYDQLRYLKNKNAYIFENITASTFLNRVCSDFLLKTGDIADSGHVIKQLLYTNDTLFDMIQDCIDETLMATGKLYYIFDDFGSISFKNISEMLVPEYIVTETNAENFDYSTSIDSHTYNRIKIQKASEDKGLSDIVVSEDIANIRQWGVLQLFEEWGENQNNPQVKTQAEAMLKLHNVKTRSLSVKDCKGDLRIRAGTSPIVQLSLGDIPRLNNYMLVEEAKHKFEQGNHTMDLTLRGKEEFYG